MPWFPEGWVFCLQAANKRAVRRKRNRFFIKGKFDVKILKDYLAEAIISAFFIEPVNCKPESMHFNLHFYFRSILNPYWYS